MQAARGTSLSPDDSSLSRSSSLGSGGRHLAVLGVVFTVVYGADQLTKVLAVDRLDEGQKRPLVGDLLALHLTRNAGAAFSTGTGYTVLLSCVAIGAVVVVLWLSRRLGSRLWAAAFGLLLAGVGGNLTDRLVRAPGPLRGQVVDFLELPHWPIFNIADMSINVAAALILVQAFRGVRLSGHRVEPSGPGKP